jgi:hypothetical protein
VPCFLPFLNESSNSDVFLEQKRGTINADLPEEINS